MYMRIALIGYGKMGHMIETIALERGHEIVARIDAGDAFDLKNAEVRTHPRGMMYLSGKKLLLNALQRRRNIRN